MVEDAKVAGEGRQDSASSQVEAAFGAVEGAVGLGVDIVEIERPSRGFDPVCPLVFANDRAELFARGEGIALKEPSACMAVDGIRCAQFAP